MLARPAWQAWGGMHRSRDRAVAATCVLLAGGLLLPSGCRDKEGTQALQGHPARADASLAAELVASEELILELTPRLKVFGPDLFAPDCVFRGLASPIDAETSYPGLGVEQRVWSTPATGSAAGSPGLADLLHPPDESPPKLSHPHFSVVAGRFPGGDRSVFETDLNCSA
ncbi:MAG: hypothetical protein GWO24_10515, partial [Akkermansiaceae bacterium]|nr:hypothetical protein [Akkermansiaceae bacterium]